MKDWPLTDIHPKRHDPADMKIVELKLRDEKPSFNLTFDLDGQTIGRFWYEDKQLKFEGEAEESAQIWVDWVLSKFQVWHDEHIK